MSDSLTTITQTDGVRGVVGSMHDFQSCGRGLLPEVILVAVTRTDRNVNIV